jgi:hypothetical protein
MPKDISKLTGQALQDALNEIWDSMPKSSPSEKDIETYSTITQGVKTLLEYVGHYDAPLEGMSSWKHYRIEYRAKTETPIFDIIENIFEEILQYNAVGDGKKTFYFRDVKYLCPINGEFCFLVSVWEYKEQNDKFYGLPLLL